MIFGVGAVVVVVVVARGAVVVVVVGGGAVVVVVVVVSGGPVGKAAQTLEASDPGTWSAGAVATVAPLWSTPTTVAPASSAFPGTASTTIPEFGVMASTEVPPDVRWTDVTPLPTQAATQPTGAPSAVPKDPVPRSTTVSAECGAEVSRGTEPLPTARSVESSITNCPHAAAGWDGTVPVDPDPEPVDDVGGVSSVPTAVPDDAVPPAGAPPPSVAPVCACGSTAGCAHMAPGGHVVGGGTMPTGGQGAAAVHPPVVLLTDP